MKTSRAKCVPLWVVLSWPPLLAMVLVATSGSFLIVNQPEKADLIVVLAGETEKRPERGLELLRQNYAPRLQIDVPAKDKIYNQSLIDLARNYVQNLPQGRWVALCPVFGLSTKAETKDVEACLYHQPVGSLLLVTSEFHARRARMIFQHQLPGYKISVAVSPDPREFGAAWWKHRQWAKNNLSEWLRLVWWQLVERWIG